MCKKVERCPHNASKIEQVGGFQEKELKDKVGTNYSNFQPNLLFGDESYVRPLFLSSYLVEKMDSFQVSTQVSITSARNVRLLSIVLFCSQLYEEYGTQILTFKRRMMQQPLSWMSIYGSQDDLFCLSQLDECLFQAV